MLKVQEALKVASTVINEVTSLVVSGDDIAVANYRHNNNSGIVLILKYQNEQWEIVHEIVPENSNQQEIGRNLSMFPNNTLAIESNDGGYYYGFNRD